MRNKFKYLLFLFGLPLVLLSQTTVKHLTFQEIKSEREAYFAGKILEKGPAFLEKEGGAYDEYQQWLHLWEPRIGPNNGTVEDYISNLTKMANTVVSLPPIPDPWAELGPTIKPTGGMSSIGGGQRGIGPIMYISFYRKNPGTMLAVSLPGGLFYSSDKGNSWTNAGSDKWLMSGCMSADFSPSDPNTWYGCSNLGGGWNRHAPESNMAIGPGGVWRTTNKGIDYALIADKNTFTVLGDQTTLHKILIDPNNAAVGYVATTGGLYKSVNINVASPARPTWYKIQSGNIEDIEFRSNNSSVLFITLQTTYTPGSNGYSQTNTWALQYSTSWGGTATSGGSWNTIPPPSGGYIANQSLPPQSEPGNLEISVTEADPNLVYVQDVKYNGPNEKIYTYNYSTAAWTLKTTLSQLTHGFGRGFGVSNANSNIVYIGNSIYLYKSTNGGSADANNVDGGTQLNPTGLTPYHVDIEYVACPSLQYCPACSTDVFIACHGGVYYSPDACSTTMDRSNGLGVAEVDSRIGQSASSKKMVAGLYHDGSILSDPASGSDPWSTVNDGDGYDAVVSSPVFRAI